MRGNTIRSSKPTFAVVFLTICTALAVAGLIFRFQHAVPIPHHPPEKDSSGALTQAGVLQSAKEYAVKNDANADDLGYNITKKDNTWRVEVFHKHPTHTGDGFLLEIAPDGRIIHVSGGA